MIAFSACSVIMHCCNGLHVETFDIVDFLLHSGLFSSLSPLGHTPSDTHRKLVHHTCGQAQGTACGQTEIAAPSPAVPINPSLLTTALLRLCTVITLLHLLHLPPLRYERIVKEWQPFKWSSCMQASIQVSDWSFVLELCS